MKLQLKKIIFNTGRNPATLILLPDFFLLLLLFLFPSYSLIFRHVLHPGSHPWQGKDRTAVAPTLSHPLKRASAFAARKGIGKKFGQKSPSEVVWRSSSGP